MSHTQNAQTRQTFFGRKRFVCSFELNGQQVHARITTPDLRQAETKTWGGWGPMHSITLLPDQYVEVRYSDGDREATHRFNPGSIGVHSPMRYLRRAAQPFYLELEDSDRRLRIRAYMDHAGRVVQTQVTSRGFQWDPTDLLFLESEVDLSDELDRLTA